MTYRSRESGGGITRTVSFSATGDNDDMQSIHLDANGYSSISARAINYATGAFDSADATAIDNILMDCTEATGGSLVGLFVAGVEPENLDRATALVTGEHVAPVLQILPVAQTQTVGLVAGVDKLSDLTTTGIDTPLWENDNDTLIIGADAPFDDIVFALTTGATGPGINATFAYSTGVGTWATLSVNDSTNDLAESGILWWGKDNPVGWVAGDVGGNYLVRITRTRNAGGAGHVVADTVLTRTSTILGWDDTGFLDVCRIAMRCSSFGSGGTPPAGLVAHEFWVDTDDNSVHYTSIPT